MGQNNNAEDAERNPGRKNRLKSAHFTSDTFTPVMLSEGERPSRNTSTAVGRDAMLKGIYTMTISLRTPQWKCLNAVVRPPVS
jgi:hypothetical protein